MKTVIIALSFLLLVGMNHGIAQDVNDEEGMKPVNPQLLWEAMPGKLEEWKMLKSTGEMGLGSWLESKAIREYERKEPPPAAGQPRSATASSMWTRILVTDTGKHPDPLAEFKDFSSETPVEDSRIKKIRIQSWPTVTKTYDDGLIVANMMVAERFLVELILKNQPKRNLRDWCRHLDFSVLKNVPDTQVIPLPPEVLMAKLDQLNPKKNKVYMMATTSESELEQELAFEEEELREEMSDFLEPEGEENPPRLRGPE